MRRAVLDVKDGRAFRAEVLDSKEATVTLFWATWCPFCRRYKPEFDKLAAKWPWRFAAVYLDDESNPLWDDYNVEVVPTLALFRDGKLYEFIVPKICGNISLKNFSEVPAPVCTLNVTRCVSPGASDTWRAPGVNRQPSGPFTARVPV